jgi:integrase
VARIVARTAATLLNQVDEKRSPRTRATVNQLMDRHMEVLDIEPTTRHTYEGYIRNHIRPLLGVLAVGRLDGEVLDSFYAQLRTCRAHCRGRKYIEHRALGEHECDDRCRLHVCRPLALAAGLPVAYWDHEQVDRQMIAADILLRSLDPADTADRIAAA